MAQLAAPDIARLTASLDGTRGKDAVISQTATCVRIVLGPVTHEVDFIDGDGNERSADDIIALTRALCQRARH